MKIVANFVAVVLLTSLIAIPIYFAQNFARVAGVKSQSKYLIVSQIDKFPNLSLSQAGEKYIVSYTKLGPSQAFLGILILNNPTDKTQTYRIEKISGKGSVFFGENIDDLKTELTLPSQTSTTISLVSSEEAIGESLTVEFTVSTL